MRTLKLKLKKNEPEYQFQSLRGIRIMKTFYRYDYVDMGYDYPDPRIELYTFSLVCETPKGYWIVKNTSFMPGRRRWIPKESRSRYAYPTKQEALINFIKRKEKYKQILKWKLEACQKALSLVQDIKIN